MKQELENIHVLTAHEVKNSVAIIKAYLDILQMDDKNENHLKMYNIMQTSLNKIAAVMQGLSEVEKTRRVEYALLDVNEMIVTLLDLYKGIAMRDAIQINYTPVPGVYLYCDGEHVMQMLINIMQNSVESLLEMKKDRQIDIRLTSFDEHIELSFRDNGRGIDPKIQPLICDAFFTTKEKGTGLGMYIINQCLQAHHATLYVESKVNEMCIIIIQMPKDFRKECDLKKQAAIIYK